ncbi:sigma-70 family RNA polymerase sigma factor [Microbacterium sp. WCS2018Hpa-9]|uniref:sigma-70 family RNA polymerase sigma factor n=1 Tax=Microbacterium sp. WCS2018Hpa-9 TaxID=3073635 RepID=UPI00288B11B9|nr:sigma-70 family RNA polymerase sigma factor [Microbacterium sp. WCS2018Hpa-9]
MNLGTHNDSDDDIPGEPSDAQIIEAVRGGDIGDFALLWRRHVESARRAARAISPSSDPDDLVSEAFASILRVTKAGGGPSDAFRPYLLATLRNTAARWARNGSALSIDTVSERDLSPEEGDAFERIAERSSIAAVFGTLSARHRTLLWYLEVEGMKPRELAPLMGMTSNAVSALAARARDSFRRAWLEAHIHDPSRSEDCRWFCERVVARRGRSVVDGDAERFSEHMNTCGGCRIVAAEIDTVSQRLRSILPAALLGGAAAAIYTGDASAEAQVLGAASLMGSTGAFVADGGAASSFGAGTPAAAHGVASVVPAGGLAALAATAVVVVGAVIFAGSVLSLSAADSDRTELTPSSSEVAIAGEAGPVREELPRPPVLPPAAEPTLEAQPQPTPTPEHAPAPDPTESDSRENPAPVDESEQPEVAGSDGIAAPSPVAPGTTPTTEGPEETPAPLEASEFRLTQSIAQSSLVPDLLQGTGIPGAIITVVDENGAVLHTAIVDEFGTFVLDISGEATHQGMTLSVSQQDAATGVTEWAEDIGPLTFATPTIARADQDVCPGVSLGAVSCLHLRAEPDAWVELLDEQGRSRTVRLPADDGEAIIRSGADERFVAARYIDPTMTRAGVTVLLPAAIE